MKIKKLISKYTGLALLLIISSSCKNLFLSQKAENKELPSSFYNSNDTSNTAKIKRINFFKDSILIALIDSALKKNQELNIFLQEINISKNEVKASKGAYLPFIGVGLGAGVEKTGRYTSKGASDAFNEIKPGKKIPEPLQNYLIEANASWEIDIWKKLRNTKKSALNKYLASVEGKNFMVTQLVSEIANLYYELIALDNQLEVLENNIEIQKNALEIVKTQKNAAEASELAVRKFEAEVLKNQAQQYYLMQKITETENNINFLVGRFPQHVKRNAKNFINLTADTIYAGIPSQLLENRPDIKQAELELKAAKLNVKIARAEFYPSFSITAAGGYNAFNPNYLIKTPQSLLYNLAGDLIAPLINRSAIKANFYSANSKQIQAAFNYEKTILKAYMEVVNQLSNYNNLKQSYIFKQKQVQALSESINISTELYKSARADYMEVLLTQRDALDSKFELIEIKKQQINSMINTYQALGGGWQ